MHPDMTLSSWVAVRHGCPIRYNVHSDDDVVFTCGSGRNTFEFVFDAGSLRALHGLCVDALHELDSAKPDLGAM